MVAPLRVGLAGLGTVGAAVVDLIARERVALAARCGRTVEVTAVTARQKARKRPFDVDKPLAAENAASARIQAPTRA